MKGVVSEIESPSYEGGWCVLVDCNSFYASCEKVFRPDLKQKPVVVLSNNDGCLVAMSSEAKKLGIKRGTPYFELREQLQQKGVTVFSSNYTLYQDLSNRVMRILAEECLGELQVYSIDEAFILLDPEYQDAIAIESLLRQLISRIQTEIGIAVSIGVARTKTLAKCANHFAKAHPKAQGYFHLKAEKEGLFLQNLPLSEVWGIGSRRLASMNAFGIFTAGQLIQRPNDWIQKQFTVVTLRTVFELRGKKAVLNEETTKPRQGIMSSKSFSTTTSNFTDILNSIANYCEVAVQKLVSQNSYAREVWVFMGESRFGENPYRASLTARLPQPTQALPEILEVAHQLASKLFLPGKKYNKTAVGLFQLSAKPQQLELFPNAQKERIERVAKQVQQINSASNQPLVRPLSCIGRGQWQMKRNFLSPRYTTCWEELPKVY